MRIALEILVHPPAGSEKSSADSERDWAHEYPNTPVAKVPGVACKLLDIHAEIRGEE